MNETTVPTDPYAAAKEKAEMENPRSWVWDEDGPEVAGYLVGTDEATTKDGDTVPLRLVLTEDTGSIWLFESPQALREGFAEKDPHIGDFIYVRRHPKEQCVDEGGGKKYFVPFDVAVIPAAEVAQMIRAASKNEENDNPFADADAATQAALEDERDERDAAVGSDLPLPIKDG